MKKKTKKHVSDETEKLISTSSFEGARETSNACVTVCMNHVVEGLVPAINRSVTPIRDKPLRVVRTFAQKRSAYLRSTHQDKI